MKYIHESKNFGDIWGKIVSDISVGFVYVFSHEYISYDPYGPIEHQIESWRL